MNNFEKIGTTITAILLALTFGSLYLASQGFHMEICAWTFGAGLLGVSVSLVYFFVPSSVSDKETEVRKE
jgi:hypothetical protein